MTEQEWQTCTDPERMLRSLGDKGSRRKAQLFACASCRRIAYGHKSGKAISAAEKSADGLISSEKMREILEAASRAAHQIMERSHSRREAEKQSSAWHAVWAATFCASNWIDLTMSTVAAVWEIDENDAEPFLPCDMLRCIFGNPFRPIALDSRWRTSTVVDLATTIYEERAFDKLPILGDALMDAGCDSEEMIHHCQNAGPHNLGCWPVDLILRKN